MAVTPVLAGPLPITSLPSPDMSVLKPTTTPGTSVIAFHSPGIPSKGTPSSRARSSRADDERSVLWGTTRPGKVSDSDNAAKKCAALMGNDYHTRAGLRLTTSDALPLLLVIRCWSD